MSEVKTYAADKITLTFGANNVTGFGDGTFITVERSVDTYTKRVGAQGEVTRTRNGDKSGRITIILMQTSDMNLILSGIQQLDEQTGEGKFPLLARDTSGESVFFAPNAWIVKSALAEYSNEATLRTWILDCDQLTMVHGGNQ